MGRGKEVILRCAGASHVYWTDENSRRDESEDRPCACSSTTRSLNTWTGSRTLAYVI